MAYVTSDLPSALHFIRLCFAPLVSYELKSKAWMGFIIRFIVIECKMQIFCPCSSFFTYTSGESLDSFLTVAKYSYVFILCLLSVYFQRMICYLTHLVTVILFLSAFISEIFVPNNFYSPCIGLYICLFSSFV